MDGDVVGFVSGYFIPNKPNTLFIWQVVVGESARGCGLAGRMLCELVQRDYAEPVQFVETTITKDNEASWRLFRKFAALCDAELITTVGFDRDEHFGGEHDTEHLVRIGPLLTNTK